MGFQPLASDLESLNKTYTREELWSHVRERYPQFSSLSPFALFVQTYAAMHGEQLSETTHGRLMRDYIAFCGCGGAPLYFARCLLPGYLNGSA